MNRVRKIIHTDYAYKAGLSGKNVTVAIMDTGIVPHVDFGNRIRYFGDFCEGKTGLYCFRAYRSGVLLFGCAL